LFEAIAGRRPWERASEHATDRRTFDERPYSRRALAMPDAVPCELAALLSRALARKLSDRYETAEAMWVALDAFCASRAVRRAASNTNFVTEADGRN
jgi:hypothetical protein